jgi:hypothetical protein
MAPPFQIDSQHAGDQPSSFDLSDLLDVGDQADDVATPIASGEVGPTPGARANYSDLE